jgi:hypothetical protein
VLVVSRFDAVDADFAVGARAALDALAARPGFVRGRLGRSTDDPGSWLLATEWVGVGAYRRALSSYEVKLAATPVLALGRDEPSAFEVLVEVEDGAVREASSDRA